MHEVGRFRSFRARFSDVVYPGDTLTTQCWVGKGRCLVRVKTNRGVALKNAVSNSQKVNRDTGPR